MLNEERISEMQFDNEKWQELYALRTKTANLHSRRLELAEEVIDEIAEAVGGNYAGLCLYFLGTDDKHPIIENLEKLFDRSGDKVKMKKRIEELENENSVLRSLIKK